MKHGGRLLPAAAVLAAAMVVASGDAVADLACARYAEFCKDCREVRILYAEPRESPWPWRGRALWTPLYAAYFHDCLALARDLLKRGDDPQAGGEDGDLLATVILWERFDEATRLAWAGMLMDYGASLDYRGLDGRTTRERLGGGGDGREDIRRLLTRLRNRAD